VAYDILHEYWRINNYYLRLKQKLVKQVNILMMTMTTTMLDDDAQYLGLHVN